MKKKLWGLLRDPFHPFRITQTITPSASSAEETPSKIFSAKETPSRENNFLRFQSLTRLEIMLIDWGIWSARQKTETG